MSMMVNPYAFAAAGPTYGDPVTFGPNGGEIGFTNPSAGTMVAHKLTLAAAMRVDQMRVDFPNTGSGTANVRLCVYDATGASGGPGILLAQTAPFAYAINTIVTQDVLTPADLDAGAIWIGIHSDGNGNRIARYNGTPAASSQIVLTDTFSDGLASPAGTAAQSGTGGATLGMWLLGVQIL